MFCFVLCWCEERHIHTSNTLTQARTHIHTYKRSCVYADTHHNKNNDNNKCELKIKNHTNKLLSKKIKVSPSGPRAFKDFFFFCSKETENRLQWTQIANHSFVFFSRLSSRYSPQTPQEQNSDKERGKEGERKMEPFLSLLFYPCPFILSFFFFSFVQFAFLNTPRLESY